MGDTITIWPGEHWDAIEKLDELAESSETELFDSRNEAITEAIEFYLLITNVLGDEEIFLEASDRDRRMMVNQALVDYRREYLDG